MPKMPAEPQGRVALTNWLQALAKGACFASLKIRFLRNAFGAETSYTWQFRLPHRGTSAGRHNSNHDAKSSVLNEPSCGWEMRQLTQIPRSLPVSSARSLLSVV